MGRGKGFAGVQYKFTERPEKTEKTRPAEVGPRAGQGSGGSGGKGPEVAGQGSGGSGGAGEWWGMGAEVAENERETPACHPLPPRLRTPRRPRSKGKPSPQTPCGRVP